MGCDIHMVVERRYEDRWVGLHAMPHGYTTVVYCHEPGFEKYEDKLHRQPLPPTPRRRP